MSPWPWKCLYCGRATAPWAGGYHTACWFDYIHFRDRAFLRMLRGGP